MSRSPILDSDYRPQFSGHETFPFRYGWLKKAFDAVRNTSKAKSKSIFSKPDAIADFGVGKNMVMSMKHWAVSMGVLEENAGGISVTALGEKLFAPKGLDPYLENPSTLWLLHWNLANVPKKTTWYWAFNLCAQNIFDRNYISQQLSALAKEQNWQRSSSATIKRDVDCLIRSYVPKPVSKKFGFEDSVECPLSELGLIRNVDSRDKFQFVYGNKNSLGMGVFLYALDQFWHDSKPNSLSLESIAHEEGSPGRVFRLSEDDLLTRFSDIENMTNQNIRWSETAGLKQLIRTSGVTNTEERLNLLDLDYQPSQRKKRA